MHFVRLPARLSVIGWLLCCVMSFTSHAGSSSTGAAVERIAAGKLEDRVLLTLQAGMTAMDEGDLQLAGQLFDDALEGITAVYGNSEQAARARGLWQNEQSKIYKGEPYERAMAHYYRGLLDLMAGDYDNARASFRGGLLQDAFAEEGQHRADFALLVFLDAWCSQQLGDEALANESYAELEGLRPGFQRPPADHRILVIGETGRAPRKLQDGIGGNKLVYRRGKRIEEESVQLRLGSGQLLPLAPIESIYWQASTRGSRPIDAILDGKFLFKNDVQTTTDRVSGLASVATTLAPVFNAGGGYFAGIAGVAGLVTLATAEVKTRADARYWNNLPDMVHVSTLPGDVALIDMHLEFLDRNGAVIPHLARSVASPTDGSKPSVLWGRSLRADEVDAR